MHYKDKPKYSVAYKNKNMILRYYATYNFDFIKKFVYATDSQIQFIESRKICESVAFYKDHDCKICFILILKFILV